VPDDGSTLRLEAAEGGNWLVCETVEGDDAAAPCTREWSRRARYLCSSPLDQPLGGPRRRKSASKAERPVATRAQPPIQHAHRCELRDPIAARKNSPSTGSLNGSPSTTASTDWHGRWSRPVDIAVEPQTQVHHVVDRGACTAASPATKQEKVPRRIEQGARQGPDSSQGNAAEQRAAREQNLDPTAARAAVACRRQPLRGHRLRRACRRGGRRSASRRYPRSPRQ